MWAKSLFLALTAVLAGTTLAWAQSPADTGDNAPSDTWRNANSTTSDTTRASSDLSSTTDRPAAQPIGTTVDAGHVAQVSTGKGTLPNEHGQLWREYDISPYTTRVTTTNRPEQAVVDWVLRETGYETWHGEPMAILSATKRSLRVYHTPDMQRVVADVVDRFVTSEAETHSFCLRLVTVDHPNWRARNQRLLKPVPVQTSGVQAWLLQKEDAAILLAELQRRSDYREHSSPHLMVNNGQSAVISAQRGRNYVRSVLFQNQAWPGYQPEPAMLDEGFSLEFSPLLSVDGQVIDATVKCNIDQVEKLIPVMVDVPTNGAPRQRAKIEVPQIVHFRFHERFRWPVDQVLLIGLGMIAQPVPGEGKSLLPGIPLPLPTAPPRADVLIFVESKGKAGEAPRINTAGRSDSTTYQGRY